MKLHKKPLALAVGALVGAAALAPATSFGFNVDVEKGLITSSSGADTLLFPIYTTAVGAQTSFSTTNTGGSTIVAKIRFREQEHSMDVLDFLVVYSPYDKFDFWVTQGEDVRPTMRWRDNSCVVGPALGGEQQFPPPSLWVETDEQMSVGHLEVLGMFTLDDVYWSSSEGRACYGDCPSGEGFASLAAAADHGNTGEPANCNLLVNVLSSPTAVASIKQATGLEFGEDSVDVPNDLIGRYVITGADGGIEAGGDAIAIANSDLGEDATAQSSADVVNSTQEYDWDGREWDHPHLGEMRELDTFQELLSASAVAGDWSNNPANFVGVDWIVSFPSKYAYLDYNVDDGEGGCPSTGWCLLEETRTGNGEDGIWAEVEGDALGTGNLCLRDNDPDVWDTEEQESAANVSVSPGSRAELDICNELNILTLAGEGQDVRTSVIQTEARRQVVEFTNLDAIRGWGKLTFTWASGDGNPGGAVNALSFTSRATADPAFNNASLTTLQKFPCADGECSNGYYPGNSIEVDPEEN